MRSKFHQNWDYWDNWPEEIECLGPDHWIVKRRTQQLTILTNDWRLKDKISTRLLGNSFLMRLLICQNQL